MLTPVFRASGWSAPYATRLAAVTAIKTHSTTKGPFSIPRNDICLDEKLSPTFSSTPPPRSSLAVNLPALAAVAIASVYLVADPTTVFCSTSSALSLPNEGAENEDEDEMFLTHGHSVDSDRKRSNLFMTVDCEDDTTDDEKDGGDCAATSTQNNKRRIVCEEESSDDDDAPFSTSNDDGITPNVHKTQDPQTLNSTAPPEDTSFLAAFNGCLAPFGDDIKWGKGVTFCYIVPNDYATSQRLIPRMSSNFRRKNSPVTAPFLVGRKCGCDHRRHQGEPCSCYKPPPMPLDWRIDARNYRYVPREAELPLDGECDDEECSRAHAEALEMRPPPWNLRGLHGDFHYQAQMAILYSAFNYFLEKDDDYGRVEISTERVLAVDAFINEHLFLCEPDKFINRFFVGKIPVTNEEKEGRVKEEGPNYGKCLDKKQFWGIAGPLLGNDEQLKRLKSKLPTFLDSYYKTKVLLKFADINLILLNSNSILLTRNGPEINRNVRLQGVTKDVYCARPIFSEQKAQKYDYGVATYLCGKELQICPEDWIPPLYTRVLSTPKVLPKQARPASIKESRNELAISRPDADKVIKRLSKCILLIEQDEEKLDESRSSLFPPHHRIQAGIAGAVLKWVLEEEEAKSDVAISEEGGEEEEEEEEGDDEGDTTKSTASEDESSQLESQLESEVEGDEKNEEELDAAMSEGDDEGDTTTSTAGEDESWQLGSDVEGDDQAVATIQPACEEGESSRHKIDVEIDTKLLAILRQYLSSETATKDPAFFPTSSFGGFDVPQQDLSNEANDKHAADIKARVLSVLKLCQIELETELEVEACQGVRMAAVAARVKARDVRTAEVAQADSTVRANFLDVPLEDGNTTFGLSYFVKAKLKYFCSRVPNRLYSIFFDTWSTFRSQAELELCAARHPERGLLTFTNTERRQQNYLLYSMPLIVTCSSGSRDIARNFIRVQKLLDLARAAAKRDKSSEDLEPRSPIVATRTLTETLAGNLSAVFNLCRELTGNSAAILEGPIEFFYKNVMDKLNNEIRGGFMKRSDFKDVYLQAFREYMSIPYVGLLNPLIRNYRYKDSNNLEERVRDAANKIACQEFDDYREKEFEMARKKQADDRRRKIYTSPLLEYPAWVNKNVFEHFEVGSELFQDFIFDDAKPKHFKFLDPRYDADSDVVKLARMKWCTPMQEGMLQEYYREHPDDTKECGVVMTVEFNSSCKFFNSSPIDPNDFDKKVPSFATVLAKGFEKVVLEKLKIFENNWKAGATVNNAFYKYAELQPERDSDDDSDDDEEVYVYDENEGEEEEESGELT